MIGKRQTHQLRLQTVIAFALGVSALAACAEPRRGVIAASDLVSLDLSGDRSRRSLRLDAAPGARINARFSPVLELQDGTVLTFTGDELTADSSYFVASPRAEVRAAHSGAGTLRASVCPANLRVCRSVVLDVDLPR